MSSSDSPKTPAVRLAVVTLAAISIQGYHLGVDDAAIYIPGIKKAADPDLYPFGTEFFASHADLTLFPKLVGGLAQFTGIPVDHVIFACHITGLFLLLLAAWHIVSLYFKSPAARWCGVSVLAAVLGIPVAGTALTIFDPYVTSRTLSAPCILFAVAALLANRPLRAVALLVCAASIHVQMSVYAAALMGCYLVTARRNTAHIGAFQVSPGFLLVLPFVFEFTPAQGWAREALYSRTYFFISQWRWYEWIGALAPIATLWLFSRVNFRAVTPAFHQSAAAMVMLGVGSTLAAVLLATVPRLENYTRLQPMRSFHLIYLVFFLMLGGLGGEYLLRTSILRWTALFFPLGVSLWAVQHAAFPSSAHIELPGAASENPWTEAFLWIRRNTPKDAIFALDPRYLVLRDEDMHGFRAIAERSQMADEIKDSGVVSLFPYLADSWHTQVKALAGWNDFRFTDYRRLAHEFGVGWVVIRREPVAGLSCPYQRGGISVCHIQVEPP